MCEWNYKVNQDGSVAEKSIEDNILFSVRTAVQKVWWRIRFWDHGPECKIRNLFIQLLGGFS